VVAEQGDPSTEKETRRPPKKQKKKRCHTRWTSQWPQHPALVQCSGTECSPRFDLLCFQPESLNERITAKEVQLPSNNLCRLDSCLGWFRNAE